MKIVISKDVLGFDSHLMFSEDSWQWVSSPDSDSLLWGFNSARDLREAGRALDLKINFFENTPWMKSQSALSPAGKIRWFDCLPMRDWKSIVKKATDQLWCAFSEKDNSYYISTHLRNREVIETLERPFVDVSMLKKSISSSNQNLKKSLLKFAPDDKGLCPKFSYSLAGSVTGRMTISEGPNVLTMKRKDRNIFKSRYEDGCIIEVDISSAEPRVALSLFGKSVPGDVYTDVINKAGIKITRSDAKIATLSALYGASHHSLSAKLSNPKDASKVLDTVKGYFGVHFIEKMIKEQHDSYGYVKNTHGRKIFSDPPSLNHFIQSSSVDVSFDVFESLIQKISEEGIVASPIFLIHDAIGIDIKRSDVKKLEAICARGIESKTLGIRLPVKSKEIK